MHTYTLFTIKYYSIMELGSIQVVAVYDIWINISEPVTLTLHVRSQRYSLSQFE